MEIFTLLDADGAGGDDIRDRINQLAGQLQANPQDEKLTLQLAHSYAQVYLKTHNPEALQNLYKALTRSITLDKGLYSKQIKQVLNAVGKDAVGRGDKQVLAQFKTLNDRLNEKLAPQPEQQASSDTQTTAPVPKPVVAPTPAPQAKNPKPQTSPAPQKPKPAPPVPLASEAEENVEDVVPTIAPPAKPRVEAVEEKVDSEPLPMDGEFEAPVESRDMSHMMRNAPGDIQADVETVGGQMVPDDLDFQVETIKAKPSLADFSDINIEMETPLASGDESAATFDETMAGASQETMREIDALFDEEDIQGLISLYMSLPTGRAKSRIVQGMISRLKEWRIEPVLALAAVENDDHMLRQIIRIILKSDRQEICSQIDLASYSPDLQKIAVTVLAELGLRSALEKLKGALEIEDPVVRTVAVHGIGRAGKGGIPYIPTLVKTAQGDPNAAVRLSAAKSLGLMNTREAYEALLEAAKKSHLDATVLEALDRMETKFDKRDKAGSDKGGGKSISAAEKQARLDAKQKAQKQLIMLIVVLAVLAGVIYYLYMKFREVNPVAPIIIN